MRRSNRLERDISKLETKRMNMLIEMTSMFDQYGGPPHEKSLATIDLIDVKLLGLKCGGFN